MLRLSSGGLASPGEALSLLEEGAGLDKFAALRPCGCLSSGEKTRLALCSVAFAPRHLLLLDEPSAFLSANAVESLAASLAPEAWPGTLVVATNDRATADALHATHTLLIAKGAVTMHARPPNDADWEWLAAAPSRASPAGAEDEEQAPDRDASSSAQVQVDEQTAEETRNGEDGEKEEEEVDEAVGSKRRREAAQSPTRE